MSKSPRDMKLHKASMTLKDMNIHASYIMHVGYK